MKYTNTLLTLIAIFLVLILLRLSGFESLINSCKESNDALSNAQGLLIGSNQRLENEIINLREKIAELEVKVLKR
jgi:hypothetical protein